MFVMKRKFNLKMNPWQYLVISFIFLISAGTLLLYLLPVTRQGKLSFVDALFTSTSAVCVTGLTTIPTSSFNQAGQIIILLLIQLGAIGIMTLTSSFLLILKGKISLTQKMMFSGLQNKEAFTEANIVLKNILKITFITEFIGFVVLSIGFMLQGIDWRSSLYEGFFHSISAFCNAGFSTFDSSLIGMNSLIKISISILIIIGGLGYLVIYEVIDKKRQWKKLSLHSKIVLLTSILLIIGGSLFIYFGEWKQISLVDSFFQSVTTRTAGFNSVEINKMPIYIIFLLMLLMFIGASPGSTGGGIKTTTFFVIIYSVFSILKGKKQLVVFNRSIPFLYIMKAFATTVLYAAFIFTGVILLLETNNIGLKEGLFEAVSAMGTVGLSLGITPLLNTSGKIIIIALMFIGRLGPASLALATLKKRKETKIKYPQGEIY
jgi:trk system potassium uptake protein TrkH